MTNDYHQRSNLEREIMALIRESVKNFRHSPRESYLTSLAKEFSARLKIHEVEKILRDLHRHKDVFPPIAYFEGEIKTLERARYKRTTSPDGVAVMVATARPPKRVAGVPILAEVLFQMIENNQTNTGAWKFARRRMSQFNDEQLWQAYEQWKDRKLPDIFVARVEAEKAEAAALFGAGAQ